MVGGVNEEVVNVEGLEEVVVGKVWLCDNCVYVGVVIWLIW